MIESTDKELLNALGIEVEKQTRSSLNSEEEKIISGFLEIRSFFEDNQRLPLNEADRDIFERKYAIRLKIILKNSSYKSLLQPYDQHGILDSSKSYDNLNVSEDIPDKLLLKKLGINKNEEDISSLKYVRSSEERRIVDEFAKREVCQNFQEFKHFFEKLKIELKKNLRETFIIKNPPLIKPNLFFILGGQTVYVADVGTLFKQEYGISDARLHLIFDNGTESRMLLRSFQKALSLDSTSRGVTEYDLGPLFTDHKNNDDLESGTLYILQSESDLSIIKENRNLIHKIGFTKGSIKKRILNSKIDPTFLMAEVKVVASYKLYNIKSSMFENLVQKIFHRAKLNIQVKDRFGNLVSPKEWFLVPLEIIQDAIQKIIDGTITEYIYDPSEGKLVKINTNSPNKKN